MGERMQCSRFMVDVVRHCNLQCNACNHFAPFADEHFEEPEALGKQLALAARYMHADRLDIGGGEPLLHPDIVAVIAAARRSGVAGMLAVVTNGVLLERQGPEFWRSVDRVQISLYEHSAGRVDLVRAREAAMAHDTELVVSPRPVFRHQVIDEPNTDADLVREIFRTCPLQQRCRAFRSGRLFLCTAAACLPERRRRLGLAFDFAEEDGLLIEERDDMARRVRDYVARTEPLRTCAYCLGAAGVVAEHRMMTAEELASPALLSLADCLDRAELAERVRRQRWNRRLRVLPRSLRRRLGLTPVFRALTSHGPATPMLEWLWHPPRDGRA